MYFNNKLQIDAIAFNRLQPLTQLDLIKKTWQINHTDIATFDSAPPSRRRHKGKL